MVCVTPQPFYFRGRSLWQPFARLQSHEDLQPSFLILKKIQRILMKDFSFFAPLHTCFYVSFLLSLFFDPEDGGDMFFRNLG
jgi:hypothetical protein